MGARSAQGARLVCSFGAGEEEGEECENDAYRYLRVRNDC